MYCDCFISCVSCTVVVSTCFVICGCVCVCVCMCMCGFCNVWVRLCVGVFMYGFCNVGCVYVWVL